MDNENLTPEFQANSTPQSSFARIFSLLIKAALASAILHFLFIYYFPLDFFDRLFSTETPSGLHTPSAPEAININLSAGTSSQTTEQEIGNSNDSPEASQADSGGLDGIDKDKWGELLERLEKNTGFQQGFHQTYENFLPNTEVGNAYKFRDRKHEDIVIKEVFPTIHDIEKPFHEILKQANKKMKDYTERNDIIEAFRDPLTAKKSSLEIRFKAEEEVEGTPVLNFPPAERQAYFDKTLAEDKTKQLGDFIQKYFKYDPNKGDLPIATRELYYQNLERLLYSFSTDNTYFYLDYYLENLNKEDFLFNALDQVSKLDGSKTATELLFILQELYDIQQRAWRVYFDFGKTYEKISKEKGNRLRVETLRRVDERYKPVLESKNLTNYAELQKKYLQRRLEITDHIINNTPNRYRIHDAQFAQASVLWEMGVLENNSVKINQAIQTWNSLLNQASQNTLSDIEKEEFTNLPFLFEIEKHLTNYQRSPDRFKPALAQNISALLTRKDAKRIAEKHAREMRLLWSDNR